MTVTVVFTFGAAAVYATGSRTVATCFNFINYDFSYKNCDLLLSDHVDLIAINAMKHKKSNLESEITK